MRSIGIIVLLVISLAAFSQQVEVRSPMRFLALGDSYTIGQSVSVEERWPNQLAAALADRGVYTEILEIIAQTGWRTDNLLDAIETENPATDYNLVSLLVGVNNQYQGVDIEVYPVEFEKLLKKAVTFAGGNKNSVFVLSIPDYGFTPFGAGNQANISAEIDRYNEINREITQEMGIAWFNITPISREALNKPGYLAPDNLHPGGEMYAAWVDLILESGKLVVATSAQSETKQGGTKVYPNPANDEVTIWMPHGDEIEIYDSRGVRVWEQKGIQQNRLHIAISGWSDGIYYYRVKYNNRSSNFGKFVKQ